jgi:hypothetical protein
LTLECSGCTCFKAMSMALSSDIDDHTNESCDQAKDASNTAGDDIGKSVVLEPSSMSRLHHHFFVKWKPNLLIIS